MAAPPPSSAPPPGMNRDVVEIVRKKMAPPSGPPPAGMKNAAFSAPKKISEKNKERDAIAEREDNYHQNDYDDEEDYNRRRNKNGSAESSTGRRANSKDLKLDTEDEPYDYTYAPRNSRDAGRGYKETDRIRQYDDEEYYDDRNYDDEDDYYDEEEEGQEWVDDRQRDENSNSSSLSPKPRPKDNRDWGDDNSQSKATGRTASTDSRPISAAAAEVKQQQGVNAALATLRGSAASTATASPGRIVFYNFQKILTATYRELKNFVTSPCPPGVAIRCYIERNRSGTKMLSPFYSVCADLEGKTTFYFFFESKALICELF